MTNPLSSAQIDVPCPKCRKKFKQALAGLKDNAKLTCPLCGSIFTLRMNKSISGSPLNKSLERLTRSINRLK